MRRSGSGCGENERLVLERSKYRGARHEFNLRFPGQYFDRETSTAYNYFRDYDPQTGRYVQSDPIGLAGGINPYAYVDNRPTTLTDAYGLWAVVDDAIFAGAGALVGLAGQGIGDLVSGNLSGWERYTAAAVGGAIGGETLLYTANPFLAGAAGGLVTNVTAQTLERVVWQTAMLQLE